NLLQQKLDKLSDPTPRFHYHQVELNQQKFGVIEIPAYQEIGPFMPRESIHGVWVRNVLYWRNGTQNAEASPAEQKRIHAWFRRSAPFANQIAEAFAREKEQPSSRRATGQRLAQLAKDASKQGDFHAAEKAFLCLLQLAGVSGGRSGTSSGIRAASPITAGAEVLKRFIETDFGLTISALYGMRKLAAFGEADFLECHLATHSIPPCFFAVAEVLCRTGRLTLPSDCAWAYKVVGETMAGVLMSASMLLHFQGIPVPTPAEHLWIGLSEPRTIPPDADIRTAPFVWAANRIGMSSQQVFDAAVKSLVFKSGIPRIGVNQDSGSTREQLCNSIDHWACLPSYSIIVDCNVRSEDEAQDCRNHLADLRSAGDNVAAATEEFVRREGYLILNRGDKTPVEWFADSISQRMKTG
ncbi:MAG TPA: hypothetical protein VIT23_17550, partial [Terrimicrobiaceae bacterium]